MRALTAGELVHATGGVQPEPLPWRDLGPILVRPIDPVIRPIDIIVRPPPLPWTEIVIGSGP